MCNLVESRLLYGWARLRADIVGSVIYVSGYFMVEDDLLAFFKKMKQAWITATISRAAFAVGR